MKKLSMAVMLTCAAFFAGCKSIPSTSTTYMLSEALGVAAGKACELVMEQGKFDDKTRAVTLEVLKIAADVVPETNTTFTAAWAPVVEETVAKFVADGKIDAAQDEMIKTAMYLVTKALDYEFETRHPTWKQHIDIVSAAIHGFVDGFTYVIRPASGFAAGVTAHEVPPIDEDAYEFLTKGASR